MPHAQPPTNPPDALGTNDEESGTHAFFPLVGNFNAVVPLSEIDSESPITAPAPVPLIKRPLIRAATRERMHDEHEEATLVPARAARTSKLFRPATRRPSWPVMIMALALSLAAGLAAGVYLIKSGMPVEIQAPASLTEDAAHEAATVAETTNSQPTQVASESRPEARPQAETNLDAAAPAVDTKVSSEKTTRDLTAPKRVTAADAPSGRGEHTPDALPTKTAVAERTPERPARKAPPSTTDTPAPTEAIRTRRATSVAERPPVQRAPERSLPVSSPPSSAKSKRVIQWP